MLVAILQDPPALLHRGVTAMIFNKYVCPPGYYVYAYIRKNNSNNAMANTPYYIGKGKDRRAWSKQHNVKIPTDSDYIVILECNLTEVGALALERRYIQWYGRINNQTGILHNLTDGGEGTSGKIVNSQVRSAISHAKKLWHLNNNTSGDKNPMYGKTHSESVKAASKERAIKTGFIGNRKGCDPWNKGLKNHISENTKNKMSASRLKTPKITCVHCKKSVSPHMLVRWHNDKCKLIVPSD